MVNEYRPKRLPIVMRCAIGEVAVMQAMWPRTSIMSVVDPRKGIGPYGISFVNCAAISARKREQAIVSLPFVP